MTYHRTDFTGSFPFVISTIGICIAATGYVQTMVTAIFGLAACLSFVLTLFRNIE